MHLCAWVISSEGWELTVTPGLLTPSIAPDNICWGLNGMGGQVNTMCQSLQRFSLDAIPHFILKTAL